MKLTVREHEIVTLLRADPMLDAAALAERIGSTRAAVSVHLSNLMKKGVVRGRGYLLRPEADTVLVVGGAAAARLTSCPPDAKTSKTHIITKLNKRFIVVTLFLEVFSFLAMCAAGG